MSDMRIVTAMLKLSGEQLAGPENKYPYDYRAARGMCQEVTDAIREAPLLEDPFLLRVAIVLGGGNLMRGKELKLEGFEPNTADHMGMMATMINAMAVQDLIEKILGQGTTRVLSALEIRTISEFYIQRRAMRHLEKGRVVIFAAGTGNPGFSTDTAAALRANAIGANYVLKATEAEGVFDDDPKKNPDAKLLKRVSYERCIRDKLGVMDMTAFTVCEENNIPIRVISAKPGSIKRALLGEDIGSLVSKAA